MVFNIAVKREQEQRLQADLVAVEAQIDKETDGYSAGDFDGVIGIDPNPEMWTDLSYRNGYLTGLTRFYDQKYQVSVEQPF